MPVSKKRKPRKRERTGSARPTQPQFADLQYDPELPPLWPVDPVLHEVLAQRGWTLFLPTVWEFSPSKPHVPNLIEADDLTGPRGSFVSVSDDEWAWSAPTVDMRDDDAAEERHYPNREALIADLDFIEAQRAQPTNVGGSS